MVGFLKTLGTDSQFVSFHTQTEVRMRKTGNPFVGTVKVTKLTGLIGVNFVKAVRRRMAEILGMDFVDTEYTPGSTWYTHLQTDEGKPLPLCVHQEDEQRFYVQFFPHPRKYRNTEYHLRGRKLTEAEVALMKTFVVKREGDEFKPVVITLAIDSIRKMSVRRITVLNNTVNRLTQTLTQLRPAQKRVPATLATSN